MYASATTAFTQWYTAEIALWWVQIHIITVQFKGDFYRSDELLMPNQQSQILQVIEISKLCTCRDWSYRPSRAASGRLKSLCNYRQHLQWAHQNTLHHTMKTSHSSSEVKQWNWNAIKEHKRLPRLMYPRSCRKWIPEIPINIIHRDQMIRPKMDWIRYRTLHNL